MKRYFFVFFLAITLGTISHQANSTNSKDPNVLRVALLPDENASTIIKNNQELKHYLEKRLQKKVELVVTTDYSSMIEAMRFGRLELAYFGALSYTLAKSKADIEAFASLLKGGTTTYHGVIISNIKANINTLEDIAGKNMAFGDIASTSSHLIPRAELLAKGLEINRDYKPHYLGAHDAVAIAVQNGHAQAGGLSQPIFESLVERGIIDLKKVKVVAVSEPYPNYPWSMQSNLKPDLKEKIKKAFLEMNDPKILKHFKANGFGKVTDADFDIIRKTSALLKLTK